MSNFRKCEICKEFDLMDRHKCQPVFYYKFIDWDDEFVEIRAFDFKEAAEKFGEKYNDEGDLMNNEIEVIISDGKIEKKFCVSAEPDVHYSATELKNK
jgi:hypothetical protein